MHYYSKWKDKPSSGMWYHWRQLWCLILIAEIQSNNNFSLNSYSLQVTNITQNLNQHYMIMYTTFILSSKYITSISFTPHLSESWPSIKYRIRNPRETTNVGSKTNNNAYVQLQDKPHVIDKQFIPDQPPKKIVLLILLKKVFWPMIYMWSGSNFQARRCQCSHFI